jgi:phenylpropionate dioxygenase-like ring-hydroxylating dioxygenase large terminal subunit
VYIHIWSIAGLSKIVKKKKLKKVDVVEDTLCIEQIKNKQFKVVIIQCPLAKIL